MSNWIDFIGSVLPLNPMISGSGLTAYLLLFASVAGGLAMSLQWIPAKRRAVFLSYHKFISQAAFNFGVHSRAGVFLGQIQASGLAGRADSFLVPIS